MNVQEPIQKDDSNEEESKTFQENTAMKAKKRWRQLNYNVISVDYNLGNTENLTTGDTEPAVDWGQWWERKDRINAMLIQAIQKQNLKQMVDLLNEQTQMYGVVADLNHRLDFDETPLHMAVRSGNIESIQLLIKYFAEINA